MKIHLEQSGGFAGITKKHTIDVKNMTSEEQIQIQELVTSIKNKNLEKTIAKDTIPDSFQYKIIVENEGGKYTINTNEFQMNSGLKELIDLLERKI